MTKPKNPPKTIDDALKNIEDSIRERRKNSVLTRFRGLEKKLKNIGVALDVIKKR